MTAQFDDIVRYRRANYSIAGTDGDGLFDPSRYGMKPVAWCSACWRGYLTYYEVKNRELYLSRLEVCLTEQGSGEQKDFRRTLGTRLLTCQLIVFKFSRGLYGNSV